MSIVQLPWQPNPSATPTQGHLMNTGQYILHCILSDYFYCRGFSSTMKNLASFMPAPYLHLLNRSKISHYREWEIVIIHASLIHLYFHMKRHSKVILYGFWSLEIIISFQWHLKTREFIEHLCPIAREK